ncbi:type I-E CRISPR-associated protein Cas6/Cse3/CasE [Pseudidiomarina salilacus]|uniref:type I-E CRISPR-associated protein Cas6/Cse3/CasE n=1 Tax=Pseudidiomarina salilacus TaxID=3384452 RepID=UPI003984CBA3
MTMIASVLHLDRRAMKALRITDPYSLHRVVYGLFEDVRNEEQKHKSTSSGILYADYGGDIRGRKVLMLANREPMESVEGTYGEVQSRPISDDFLLYKSYRFKVIVNPTRRDNTSRKLLAVKGRDDIAKWFTERAQGSWGFDVATQSLQVDKVEVLQFKDKHQRRVTIGQAHIQGLLTVTDRAAFTKSFQQGIGRARAFGCGLLQVVPVLENPFD